jgi:hypothetical protein
LLALVLAKQTGMEVSASCVRRALHQQAYTVQHPRAHRQQSRS